MKDGVYTARRLVLISGDKGFRDVVDDLRSKEMVVYFIKPERNVCAPLTSGAQSIYLSEGKYNNWHIVAKTRSFSLNDFADKVHDNINRVLSAYTKIVGISEANVQEAKMMGTTPTIIVRFKTKEIFRVSNKKGTTHSEQDHQWTMQQTDAWEWSLSDIGK
uniref:Tim44-like domain-containing protein n=1 Tax=Brassica oleracea TaxID=3712 RepID=A0A3P6EX38_BRAOL|nr:unnamed protein product [Brassica oleracea]